VLGQYRPDEVRHRMLRLAQRQRNQWLTRLVRGQEFGSRAKGERSLCGLPAPCGARDEAVIAILEAPAQLGQPIAR